MKQKIIHRANTRGNTNIGWLNGFHSFNFGPYFDPHREAFGALKVLNDDTVQPKSGFGTHPHSNMEIISIPLSGEIRHKDSTGEEASLKTGEIQVMSAGSGIYHSEYNGDTKNALQFLQIWIRPDEYEVTPRYQQIPVELSRNELNQVVSPNPDDEGLWIHQNSWLHLAELDAGKSVRYSLKDIENGIYIFTIEGTISVEGETLQRRDAIALTGTTETTIEASAEAKILVIEVPV